MLLDQLAGNRARLVRSSILGLVPLSAVAFGGAWWIRERSASPGLDMLIITSWMLLALGLSYLLALLIGDFVFPKGWRAVQVLERTGAADNDDLSAEEVVAASKGQALPFAMIWVALVLALSFLTHVGTGGFFSWYSQYGYVTSVLRGDNQELKLRAMDEMTGARSTPR